MIKFKRLPFLKYQKLEWPVIGVRHQASAPGQSLEASALQSADTFSKQ